MEGDNERSFGENNYWPPSPSPKLCSPWSPNPEPAPDTNGAQSDHSPNIDLDLSDNDKGLDLDLSSSDHAKAVWSSDIEESFLEALAIYPACGRIKMALSDHEDEEYKTYGRNGLIARYIKLKTGQIRTRKQVSSHIQVVERRKKREREAQAKLDQNQGQKQKDAQEGCEVTSATATSAATATTLGLGLSSAIPPYLGILPLQFWQYWHWQAYYLQLQPAPAVQVPQFFWPFPQVTQIGTSYGYGRLNAASAGSWYHPDPDHGPSTTTTTASIWGGRTIATHKFCLVEFSAFMEQKGNADADTYQKHLFFAIDPLSPQLDPVLESIDIRQFFDKFPANKGGLKGLYEKGPKDGFFMVKVWADLKFNILDEMGAFYGVTSQYESNDSMTITCSTKICSFGKQVVEKVEIEHPRFENGRFCYRTHRSPMCEYMIKFIRKLKQLPEKYMMNSVLESFTILQVVSNAETQETLLCMAYVFEVLYLDQDQAKHRIYKLE